jgi:hypothetical protein
VLFSLLRGWQKTTAAPMHVDKPAIVERYSGSQSIGSKGGENDSVIFIIECKDDE